MKVLTLTRAAGRFTFGPDEELDLPDDQAQELIACGAAVAISVPVAKQAEKPSSKSKKAAHTSQDE